MKKAILNLNGRQAQLVAPPNWQDINPDAKSLDDYLSIEAEKQTDNYDIVDIDYEVIDPRTADIIKAEIITLEQRAIRPLLAGESDRVAEIRARIEALREELNAL